jgi:hypothetical protein
MHRDEEATLRRAARWGALTAALVLAASIPAHAADDKATREAEARFAEGLVRVKRKDYEGARLSFAQAYAALKRPVILWNLALSEEKSGHTLDAIGHFRQVTRDATTDEDRANAQKHVDTLLVQVGRVDVQAPPGSAFVLDGNEVAATAPLADPLDVMPGHHVVEARLPRGMTKASPVDAVAGQVAHVTFAPEPPVAQAIAAPVAAPGASAGAAAAEAQAAESPESTRSSRPISAARVVTTATLGGVAIVAAGVGAYFAIQSRNEATTVRGYRTKYGTDACAGTAVPPYCTTWNDAVNSQNRDVTASDVLYIAGAALAVGAIVTWLLWPSETRAASAWVSPSFGPSGAGVTAGGLF